MTLPRPTFILASALTAFLGTFNMAYNVGVINVPEKIFWQFLNETNIERYGVPMSQETINMLWGWIVGIVSVGGLIGAMIAPLFAEKLGRKASILIWCNVIAICSCLMMSFSQMAKSYELLAAGRFLNGFCTGVTSTLVPMYLSECSPTKYRGLMGSLQTVFINLTTILSFVLGTPAVLGTEQKLPYLLGLCIIPSLVQLMSSFFLPESPKYLYIKGKNTIAAEKSLRFWNDTKELSKSDVQKTFDEFDQEAEALSHEVGFLTALKTPYFRKVIFLAILVLSTPAWTGAPAVFSYSTDIFQKLNFDDETANICTTLLALVTTVGSIITIPLIERLRRRVVLFTGYALVALTIISYVIFAVLSQSTGWMWCSYVAMVSIQAFILVFPLAAGAVIWTIPSEIAPQAIRSAINSIAQVFAWSLWLLVSFLYPSMESALGPWTFLVFMIPMILVLIYLYKELPETAKLSVAQIVKQYSSSNLGSGGNIMATLGDDPKKVEIAQNSFTEQYLNVNKPNTSRTDSVTPSEANEIFTIA